MSQTAVVILNYNGEKLLRQFLPSVIQHSAGAEIIIADNYSSDNSIAFLEASFPQVRTIRLDRNYGFCGGYNRALKQVDADYYVLLNSDIEVTADWLVPIDLLLKNNSNIAAVQPKILSFAQKNKFEHAGAAGGFIDSFGYPFCRGRLFDYVEDDDGQYNDEREIFWASGACLVIRSEVFRKFGGFDEDFFAHMEEIDLCWKLHRASYQIYYCGKSKVYHVGAGTLSYRNPKKTYLNFRNNLAVLAKHFTTAQLFYAFPMRIVLDWIAAFQYLIKGEVGNFAAVIKSHASFVHNLNINLKKRSALRHLYPFYGGPLIYRGSIVKDYFIKGKKLVEL